jgi:ATP-dependent Clp protease protease subunit
MENEIKKMVSYYYGDEQVIEHLAQRKLIINQDIDDMIVEDATLNILKWNAEDKGKEVSERKPILVYVNSNGGSVTDGFTLIDSIVNSKTPVYTINLGSEYSMGFLIGISGHKRYAMPTATFLMHDGSGFLFGSMSKISDTANFYKEMEKRTKNYILAHSSLTPKEYDKRYTNEWYMYAEEAKKYGFVDFIVGQDVELDEII